MAQPIIDVEDKLKGTLIGVCIGDALGMNMEFKRVQPHQVYTGLVPNTPWQIRFRFQVKNIPPASVSDDTEMTLVLLESLLKNQKYVRDDVLLGYLKWANNGNPMMGRNTRMLMKGVKTVKGFTNRHTKLVEDGKTNMETMQSNGTLMRASPLALLGEKDALEAIHHDCSISNDNNVNRLCDVIYCDVLRRLLRGQNKEEVTMYLHSIRNSGILPLGVLELIEDVLMKKDRPLSEAKGWVCNTLFAGLYALLHFDTFDLGMEWVIKRHPGSDTDTNASVAGALLGAWLGCNRMMQEENTCENRKRVSSYFSSCTSMYKVVSFDELASRMHKMYQSSH